jgi:hypothetical protein
MRKYRPSYVVSIPGIGLFVAATAVGGIAIGAVFFGFSRLTFYVPLLMPTCMGVVCFFAMGFLIKKAKLPNPLLAVLFGALIGIFAYGTHHYGDYLVSRHEGMRVIGEELRTTYGDVDERLVARAFNAVLEEVTGSRGFVGYLRLTAQTGVSFFPLYELDMPSENRVSGLTLTSGWAWGYWLVEAALAGGFTAWSVAKVAREPFCEECGEWYRDPKSIGSVPKNYVQRFLELLKVGDLSQAARFVSRTRKEVPQDLEVQYQTCLNCPAKDVVLLVNQVLPDRQRRIFPKHVFEGLMAPDEYTAFLEAIRLR